MFITRDKYERMQDQIDRDSDRIRQLTRNLQHIEDVHEDELHDVRRKHEKVILSLKEQLEDLKSRTDAELAEIDQLRQERKDAEAEAVEARKQLRKVETELEKTRQKHKIESELLEHNMKLLSEAGETMLKKKELELIKDFQDKTLEVKTQAIEQVSAVKEEYNGYMTEEVKVRSEKFQEMLDTLVGKLPTVNIDGSLEHGQKKKAK